jgi:hypothetical protein
MCLILVSVASLRSSTSGPLRQPPGPDDSYQQPQIVPRYLCKMQAPPPPPYFFDLIASFEPCGIEIGFHSIPISRSMMSIHPYCFAKAAWLNSIKLHTGLFACNPKLLKNMFTQMTHISSPRRLALGFTMFFATVRLFLCALKCISEYNNSNSRHVIQQKKNMFLLHNLFNCTIFVLLLIRAYLYSCM